jgi:hypothetical protein
MGPRIYNSGTLWMRVVRFQGKDPIGRLVDTRVYPVAVELI